MYFSGSSTLRIHQHRTATPPHHEGQRVDLARDRWRFLSEPEAQRLVGAYGSRLSAVLGDARSRDDLGPGFGPELTGAEVRYLIAREWARFPEDVLWRRSKLGLTMPAADRDALASFMANVM